MGLFSRNDATRLKPVAQPSVLRGYVFAVLGCAPDRNAVGAVYFGYDGPKSINPWRLLVLDWDLAPLDALMVFLPHVGARVAALTRECRALKGLLSTAFVESDGMGRSLRQALIGARVPVREIPPELCVLNAAELAATATTYAARGLVKFTQAAHAKRDDFEGNVANHLLQQITRFNIRAPDVGPTELLRSWALGTLLGLEPARAGMAA